MTDKSGIEKMIENLAGLSAGVDLATLARVSENTAATSAVAYRSRSEFNPAQWPYERLGNYVKGFESRLDNDHEIGARLVNFGQSVTFHIEDIGYHGPDIISFAGTNEKGERVQLIQNIAQLSVLLVAMKKAGASARRIGFIWDTVKKEPT
jgi:uncharacterized protein DUF6173